MSNIVSVEMLLYETRLYKSKIYKVFRRVKKDGERQDLLQE